MIIWWLHNIYYYIYYSFSRFWQVDLIRYVNHELVYNFSVCRVSLTAFFSLILGESILSCFLLRASNEIPDEPKAPIDVPNPLSIDTE